MLFAVSNQSLSAASGASMGVATLVNGSVADRMRVNTDVSILQRVSIGMCQNS